MTKHNKVIYKTVQTLGTISVICALTACSSTTVDPVVTQREMTVICIDHNPDVGENYDQEIVDTLSEMGIDSRMTGGAFPGECPHRLQTRINWSNSLIKYVVALELVITEDSRPLGDANYFVGQAHRSPERFGSAASKAKPLLEELLAEYNSKRAAAKTSN